MQMRVMEADDLPHCQGCQKRLSLGLDETPTRIPGTSVASSFGLVGPFCTNECEAEIVEKTIREWAATN